MRDTVEEFYSTCKPEDDLTDPRPELARMREERDSETRWAAHYKAERDEAVACLRELLDFVTIGHGKLCRLEPESDATLIAKCLAACEHHKPNSVNHMTSASCTKTTSTKQGA